MTVGDAGGKEGGREGRVAQWMVVVVVVVYHSCLDGGGGRDLVL